MKITLDRTVHEPLQLVFHLLHLEYWEKLVHVSKSEAYLYAVIFDHNNKNFKNGEGPANSQSFFFFFFLGGGGGEIPKT